VKVRERERERRDEEGRVGDVYELEGDSGVLV
jgi:hypothetical protein